MFLSVRIVSRWCLCYTKTLFFFFYLHDHSVYLPTRHYALAEPKSNFGLAVNEINRMRKWRLSDEPVAADDDGAFLDPKVRAETKCKIFFGYTSNLISAGTRESIRFLAQNKMVSSYPLTYLVTWPNVFRFFLPLFTTHLCFGRGNAARIVLPVYRPRAHTQQI